MTCHYHPYELVQIGRCRNLGSSLHKINATDVFITTYDSVTIDFSEDRTTKEVDSQTHGWWQGYDCDIFSVRVKVESIGELSQFYGLTCNSLIKYENPRLHGCAAVTMDPIQLLATDGASEAPRKQCGRCTCPRSS